MKHTKLTRQEIAKNFAAGLERERVFLGLTQSKMACQLDISLSAYKRILNGETTKIDLYTCYLAYALTGKLSFELCGVVDNNLKLIEKLHGLSLKQLSLIESVIDFEKAFASQDKNNIEDYITVFIPTGNMEDGMIYDSSNIEKINIANYRKKFGNAIHCGIRITSNHLHPVYIINDILLISRNAIRDGDTGIFFNKKNGCVYIRKFHQAKSYVLESINGYGENFTIDGTNYEEMDQWIFFGYVLTKIRE